MIIYVYQFDRKKDCEKYNFYDYTISYKIKAQHMEELSIEQKRLQEAKSRIRDMAHREEYRVADLEKKLSELSDLIGVYEREKEQDQSAIRYRNQSRYLYIVNIGRIHY